MWCRSRMAREPDAIARFSSQYRQLVRSGLRINLFVGQHGNCCTEVSLIQLVTSRRIDMDRLIQPRGNGYALSRDLNPRLVPVASCKPLGRETRKHPPGQVRKLA